MAEMGLEPQSGTNPVLSKPFHLPSLCLRVILVLSLKLCFIIVSHFEPV